MRRRRVTLTGAGGQLGRAVIARWGDSWEIDPLPRSEVDVRDWKAIRDRIASFQPDLVIHGAAATDVDGCETQPEMAFAVNAVGTGNVAAAAALVDAELVVISTNYVFDGTKDSQYHEFDDLNPISVYGKSKLAGEREALAAIPRCYILRTAWLYSSGGRNFVQTMRRLMTERDHLTVVSDQYGNPTSCADLATAIPTIVEQAPYGIYHVTNQGVASWHSWATEIATITASHCTIEPIPGSAWPRPATPPSNGAMNSLKLPALGIQLPDWRDALRRVLGA